MHEPYLAALEALGDAERARQMQAYHKVPRRYLGLANPQIDTLTRAWRAELDVHARVALSEALWATDIYEGRLAAAKLLTQARLRPDDQAAWELIARWPADFDSWAIADHAAMAGQKRLVADPSRLDTVAEWARSEHLWTRRAALVMTLPWTKQNHPKPAELAARGRILGWAAEMVTDHRWFIQKAIGWWLRDLSKHDAARTRDFVATHGAAMKPFAVKEALRHLKKRDAAQ